MYKKFAVIVGGLALLATIIMHRLAQTSSHLSELKDFWYYPVPLVIICVLLFFSKKKA